MGEKSRGGRETKKPKAGSVKPKINASAPLPQPESGSTKGVKK